MTAPRPVGGGGAGRRGRVHGEVETDDPLTALFRRLEFFPTGPWACRAGAELITRIDPGRWTAEDPCCGQGHMTEAIRPYFADVRASDVHDYGRGYEVRDYLKDPPAAEEVDWTVFNPPFRDGQAQAFVEKALLRSRRGVACFQATTFLDTVGRHELIFGPRGLSVMAQFAERVGLTLGGWRPGGSTATPYAWFIWVQPQVRKELAYRWLQLEYAGASTFVGLSIPPGTRARLTHADDAERWGDKRARTPRTSTPLKRKTP